MWKHEKGGKYNHFCQGYKKSKEHKKKYWEWEFCRASNSNQKYQMHYQGLSAVLYSLDPDQNKLLEVLFSITIDFYLTKVK